MRSAISWLEYETPGAKGAEAGREGSGQSREPQSKNRSPLLIITAQVAMESMFRVRQQRQKTREIGGGPTLLERSPTLRLHLDPVVAPAIPKRLYSVACVTVAPGLTITRRTSPGSAAGSASKWGTPGE